MKIVLSSHAQDRLVERGIKKADVIEAIKNPDIKCPTKNKRLTRIRKELNSKTLNVIIEEKDTCIVVVTCAISEKEA